MTPIDSFRTALIDATLATARRALEAHAGETLYSFALYTSGELNYVFATTATEEGLARVASSYVEEAKKRKGDTLRTLESEADALRWSPCDSPYHEDLGDHFEQAQEALDAVWGASAESSEDYDSTTTKVREAMLDALTRLREQRLLPETVVLNLLLGDQSDEERLENAMRLNSPEVCRRFELEMARSTR